MVSTPEGPAMVESFDAQKKLVWLRYQTSDQTRRFTVDKFNTLFVKK